MSKAILKPFLINKDEEGRVRLTVRETRYNMQNYPIVSATRSTNRSRPPMRPAPMRPNIMAPKPASSRRSKQRAFCAGALLAQVDSNPLHSGSAISAMILPVTLIGSRPFP
jgi:hypothetical protein